MLVGYHRPIHTFEFASLLPSDTTISGNLQFLHWNLTYNNCRKNVKLHWKLKAAQALTQPYTPANIIPHLHNETSMPSWLEKLAHQKSAFTKLVSW